jgi:hypothetical protein
MAGDTLCRKSWTLRSAQTLSEGRYEKGGVSQQIFYLFNPLAMLCAERAELLEVRRRYEGGVSSSNVRQMWHRLENGMSANEVVPKWHHKWHHFKHAKPPSLSIPQHTTQLNATSLCYTPRWRLHQRAGTAPNLGSDARSASAEPEVRKLVSANAQRLVCVLASSGEGRISCKNLSRPRRPL